MTDTQYISTKEAVRGRIISLPLLYWDDTVVFVDDHNNMEAYREGCKHINLAANVCNFTPVNLGKLIKDGILADIDGIHRVTIDRATERKANI